VKTILGGLVLLLAASCVAVSDTSKVKVSKSPLTPEQIAIYNAFLNTYNNGAQGIVNLGNQTIALNLSNQDANDCLSGTKLENLAETNSTVHMIGPEAIDSKKYRLVDADQQAAQVRKNDPSRTMGEGRSVKDAVNAAFASGLLEISEIAFDKVHHHAVMRFRFVCGGLCGHGATVVLEKIGDKWQPTKKSCDEWIS
jgi:hypothetical protein